MENVVEQIRQSANQMAIGLELPTHDELVLIEEEILLPIPPEFRSFLLQVSDCVCGRLEPVTAADPGAHTHLSEVTAYAWSIGLSRELMVVCQSGDGYYCIDQNGEVQFWQDGEIAEERWEDIWQWAEEVWLNC